MNENRISIELSAGEIAKINEAIQVLTDTLQPVLIALDADDKRSLAKLGERSISFVEKSAQYAETDAEFLPSFVDAGEMKKDWQAFRTLNDLLRPLQQIVRNLDDTATLCGSDAYLAALAYYNSVRLAAKMNVPKAATVSDDLSQRFEAQRANKPKPPVPPVTT